MAIEHILVLAGDSWFSLGKRYGPIGMTNKQVQDFAMAIAVTNGGNFLTPLFVGQVLHFNTATIPIVAPPTLPTLDANLFPTDQTKLLFGVSLPSGSLAMFKAATSGMVPHIGHDYARKGSDIASLLASADIKGTIPFINFKPAGQNGPAEFAAILRGDRDASINEGAAAAKAYGKKFWLAPIHEPENDDPSGLGDLDYAAAFRYIVDKFRLAGVTNVVWVWNMMSFVNWIPRYDNLFPGKAYVNVIAGDPYIHSATKTLNRLGREFYDWGKKHGLPFVWAEWGIEKAVAEVSATALLSQAELDRTQVEMPLLRGYIYWNQWKKDPLNPTNHDNDYLISNYPTQFGVFAKRPEFDLILPASYVA